MRVPAIERSAIALETSQILKETGHEPKARIGN